eukprot:1412435-Amphidinium_carterae.1
MGLKWALHRLQRIITNGTSFFPTLHLVLRTRFCPNDWACILQESQPENPRRSSEPIANQHSLSGSIASGSST